MSIEQEEKIIILDEKENKEDPQIKALKGELIYPNKDLIVAYLLWFFLGYLGIHRFYLGDKKMGLLMLICTLTFFLSFITLIIWFFDAYLTYKNVEEYNQKMTLKKIELLSTN